MDWLSNNIYAILDNPALKWVVLILVMVMPLASLLTWAERRQSAMMQDRLGPNRANIGPIKLKGILHFVADALKMISKEDFVPGNVHKGLFALAPILAMPTTAIPPPALSRALLDGGQDLLLLRALGGYTPLANLVDLPAIAVPCGVDDRGRPLSIMFIGARGSEPALLALAAAVEATGVGERVIT